MDFYITRYKNYKRTYVKIKNINTDRPARLPRQLAELLRERRRLRC